MYRRPLPPPHRKKIGVCTQAIKGRGVRALCRTMSGNTRTLQFNGLKVRTFHVPNGTVHFGCTAPNQTISRLVIVLVSRIQKSGTGDNNFYRSGLFQFDVPTKIPGAGLIGRRPQGSLSLYSGLIDGCYCFHCVHRLESLDNV